jgi:hypothetical protein
MVDPVTAIGVGGSLLGGIASLFGAGQQQANQQQQLQLAIQNYLLQKKQVDQQYELATAGRQDARGNRTKYVPGYGWVQDVTDGTRDLIQGSDAVQRQNIIDLLTRGRGERDLALNRRLDEGSVSNTLLNEMKGRYGAPTKEGVVGSNKIASVTGVSENADNAKSAYGTAALRSGTTTDPRNFSNIDTGAATGIRKALAQIDANSDPLFQQHMSSYMTGKMQPYNTMATRASNIENVPFSPETASGNMDASLANAAAVGATRGTAGASEALHRGAAGLSNAIGAQQTLPWGTFIGGLTENIKNLLRKDSKSSTIEDSWGGLNSSWKF